MNLTQLKNGKRARVVAIAGGCGVAEKLNGLGIIPGKSVTRLEGSERGGPVIIQIGPAQVAIGHGLAHKITVEALKE